MVFEVFKLSEVKMTLEELDTADFVTSFGDNVMLVTVLAIS